MGRSKSSKKSSLLIPALLIVGGLVVIITNIFDKVEGQKEISKKRPLIETTVTKTEDGVRVDNVIGGVKNAPDSASADEQNADEGISKAVLTNFWINARINIPVPHILKYEKVEVEDENIIILHGVNKNDGTDLIIIARKAMTNPHEIGPFLHESNLGKTTEKELWPRSLPSHEKTVALPPASKLQPAKIWRFRGKSQDRIISLSNRTDRVGSYVAIYTVPKGNLNRSEEFLIALLKEAIAQ